MDTLEARRIALGKALDLAGIEDEALEVLARQAQVQDYAAGELISPDDECCEGLYVVVDGLASVRARGEHRRAPFSVVLGPGGVFGEDSIAGIGMTGATAYRACTILFLRADTVLRMVDTFPGVAAVVERLTLVQTHGKWIVDRLRESALFQFVQPSDLFPLLEGVQLIVAEPGEVIFEGKEALDGMLMVVQGRVTVAAPGKVRIGRKSFEPRPVALGSGALIGDSSLVRPGPLLQKVVAGSDGARLLRFRSDVFRDQLGSSTAFRRGLFASSVVEDGERRGMIIAHASQDLEIARSNWVGLVGDAPGLGLRTMGEWLARSAAEEWGDRIAVLSLDPQAPPEPTFSTETISGKLEVRRALIHPDTRKYNAQVTRMALEADLVILDFGDLDPREQDFWLQRVRRTVYVASRAYEPIDEPLLNQITRPLVYTAVVPSGPAPVGEPRFVPRGTLRVHKDLIQQARKGTPLDQLDPGLRAQVSRWMRGVTQRSVGIALGGGGALSMAELAVLQRVHERGIPIDIVAGVSGGSVIGAFYAAGMDLTLPGDQPVPAGLQGLPGLARIIQLGADFEAACRFAMLSSHPVSRFVDCHLGAVRLEDLLIPYFPVAVDIDSATQVSIRTGPIGFGVRASGSFPGTFTPTTLDVEELRTRTELPVMKPAELPQPQSRARQHFRYVDGGMINNIPDDTVRLEGAQVVLACNVVPAPTPRSETSAVGVRATQARLRQLRGRAARLFREAEPIVRLDDVQRSVYMMLHQPADWADRSADAKFQARTRGFTFLDWAKGDEIRQQTLDEIRGPLVEEAIDELERAYHSMRWRRDANMGVDELVTTIETAVLANLPSNMTR